MILVLPIPESRLVTAVCRRLQVESSDDFAQGLSGLIRQSSEGLQRRRKFFELHLMVERKGLEIEHELYEDMSTVFLKVHCNGDLLLQEVSELCFHFYVFFYF